MLFFQQTRNEEHGKDLVPGLRLHRILFGVNPHPLFFFFILLNLEWNRCWTSWGIMFWIEWLIINSAEELSFRGTEFQGLSFKDLSLFIVTGY